MSASTLLDQDTGPVPVVVQPDPLTTTMPDALRPPHAECVSYPAMAAGVTDRLWEIEDLWACCKESL